MTRVVVIGNGIAGVTAARRLRVLQPDWSITIVSGESSFHYSRPALMYIFMGHMPYADTKPFEDHQWTRERIDLVRDWATGIDPDAGCITLHRGGTMPYDKLLVATGSKSNRFGWPGQDLDGVQGLYDLMDLHSLHENAAATTHAVVVGGGLIGIELGEMLHSRNVPVTILAREVNYWDNVLPPEEAAMVSRVIREAGFDLRLETELVEIVDDGHGRAGAVVTSAGDRIDTQLVGLTAGVAPNIDLVRGTSIATGRGVLVNDALRTSHPDVFAAGDCAEIVRDGDERNLIQQVWYTGRLQGEAVAEAMAGRDVRYDPGVWFNSAKFLDLEYQTYGRVSNVPRPDERDLYWEHESGLKSLRLVTDTDDVVIGVNVMGLRYRHDVCERWIREGRPLDHVLDHLADANFDTEFFRRHESEIAGRLREQCA